MSSEASLLTNIGDVSAAAAARCVHSLTLLVTVSNEVAKVMFLHLSVILFTGGVLSQHALQVVSQHALQQRGLLLGGGGACSWGEGVPAPGGVCTAGCLLLGACSQWGLLLGGLHTPSPEADGYCCGRYAPTGMHSCYVCVRCGTLNSNQSSSH